MSKERQIPGGAFVNETTNNQEQIPGAQYIVEASTSSNTVPTGSTRFFLAT